MSTETELKLELDPADVLRMLEDALLPAPASQEQQRDTYFDTPRLKLRRNGYSVRVRATGQGHLQTVKSLSSGAGLFERGEWEKPVWGAGVDPAALAETPVAEILHHHHGIDKLKPVISSEVRRTTWLLGQDTSAVEVMLDEGALRSGNSSTDIVELELELRTGEPAYLFDVAQRIGSQVPVRVSVLSKAERGFMLADGTLSEVAKAAPVDVSVHMSVADGFALIVGACLKHFRLNEPIVVLQRQAGALHQARVAMRRLRSAISLFRPAITDNEFPKIREELRWFTTQLGDARNLDVYLERELPPGERNQVEQRREEAYDQVIDAIRSARLRSLILELVRWVAIGSWRQGPKAGGWLGPFARKRIDKLWASIAAAPELAAMDEEARHEIRIQGKKLRYALEFMGALYAGKKQKKFAAAIETLQESLGKLNDLVTARHLQPEEPAAGHSAETGEDAVERQHLEEAERSLRELKKIGPYWRHAGLMEF